MAKHRTGDDAILWAGANVDLDQRPVTISPSARRILWRHFAHLLLYVFPTLLLLWHFLGPWWLGGGFLVAFGVLGLVDFYNGLVFAEPKAKRITFDRSLVTIEKPGFEILRADYSNYEGVLYRDVRTRFASLWPSRLHVIELWHPDADRTVPLHVTQGGGTVPRGRWKDYARRLGLPLLRMTEDGTVALSPAKVETTIQQRAQTGALQAPDGPPPKGLSLYQGEFMTEPAIRIRHHVWLLSWTGAIAMLFGVGPYLVLFLDTLTDRAGPWWIAGIFGGLFVIIIGGILLQSFMNDVLMIDAHPNSVSYSQRFCGEPSWDRLDDIEEVALDPSGKSVLVAGRNAQIEIGHGLSKDALEWLRDYILAAVARG